MTQTQVLTTHQRLWTKLVKADGSILCIDITEIVALDCYDPYKKLTRLTLRHNNREFIVQGQSEELLVQIQRECNKMYRGEVVDACGK